MYFCEKFYKMKKDINIPVVENVHVAIVHEWNPEYEFYDWNAYIINDKDVDLEMLLIVSKGYDDKRFTAPMRHKLEKLPAKSYAKIEFIQEDLLGLTNEFMVTFFENSKMFDKKYIFEKDTVSTDTMVEVPLMDAKGVLGK